MDAAAAHRSRVDTVPADLPPERVRRLRLVNAGLAVLHAAQAAVVLALSTDFSIAVVETFPEGPPGSAVPAPQPWFEVPLGPAVALFLLLAAVDHALCAAPGVRERYEHGLRRGRNVFRWTEYSVSATVMVLLIALITGVTDITALVGIAGANIAMILFGLRMERVNDHARGAVDWEPFAFGCVAGLFPWLAIVIAFGGATVDAPEGQGPPGFVLAIVVSLFLLFFSFAVVQFLQYKRVGRFRDYVVGEHAYLVLSLVAKSLLAWLVFANVLIEPA